MRTPAEKLAPPTPPGGVAALALFACSADKDALIGGLNATLAASPASGGGRPRTLAPSVGLTWRRSATA
jgi:hypothetical protein